VGQQPQRGTLLPVSAMASSSSSGRKRSRRWLGTGTGIGSRVDGIGFTCGVMYVRLVDLSVLLGPREGRAVRFTDGHHPDKTPHPSPHSSLDHNHNNTTTAASFQYGFFFYTEWAALPTSKICSSNMSRT